MVLRRIFSIERSSEIVLKLFMDKKLEENMFEEEVIGIRE
jgi:hypothetical protein